MNVLDQPECQNCLLLTINGECQEHVFRPCYRYMCMKHTKPLSWPINLNLCPSSWLRVTAGQPSWPPYTPASFIA